MFGFTYKQLAVIAGIALAVDYFNIANRIKSMVA